MSKDVQDMLKRCATCQIAKTHSFPKGLYTPLPVLSSPWVDVTVDFMLGFSWTQRNKDSVYVAVDRFLKMAHCIPCNKTIYATHVAEFVLQGSHEIAWDS